MKTAKDLKIRHFIVVTMCFFALSASAQYTPIVDMGDERTIGPSLADSLNAPYDLKAVTNMSVDSTYYRVLHFNGGIRIPIKVLSSCSSYAFFFYADDPSIFSVSFKSSFSLSVHQINDSITIPQTGNYVLLVTSRSRGTVGFCNVDYGKGGTNAKLAFNYIPCEMPPYQEFNTFATSGVENDVQLFVLAGSNPGTIVAYNDNYAGTGNHQWGLNARIKQTFSSTTNGVIVNCVKKGSLSNRKANVYVECKTAAFTKAFFPNYNLDDAISSAPLTPLGSAFCYNCFAWAGKEWSDFVDPSFELSEYYSPNSQTQCFDNYFNS